MNRFLPYARRVIPWLRLASEYTAAHMAARLLAAISGLMLVRLLPLNEYGIYTLMLAAFTFICTFSDLGATETLSYFRWRAGKKNRPWAPYFHTVMRFRRTIYFFGLLSAAVYVFYTARHIQVGMHTIIAGIALIGMAAWFTIHSSIISYVFKLEQRFRQAYAVEISNELIKLMIIVAIWGFEFPTALAGMVSITLSALFAALLAKQLLGESFAKGCIQRRSLDHKYRRILLGQVSPVIPGAIYYAMQGPLVAGLAAYFGSVVNVAEVGAMGRLGALVAVIAGFTSTVFVPRLLVITDEKLFLRRYLHWWIVIIVFGASILLTVAIFPNALLLILGKAYSGLHNELLIAAATAVIGTWATYAWGVNRARGWVKYQPLGIPVLIIGQVLMLVALDLTTTIGVLLFGFGTGIIGLGYQLIINCYGFLIIIRSD